MNELLAQLGRATNVLLCGQSPGESDDHGTPWSSLLASGNEESTVLWVTYARSPDDCLEVYRESDWKDASLVVVALGTTAECDTDAENVTVETISSSSDLTCLGITISRVLSRREDVVLYFESVTALLRHVDLETAYPFLHAVTGQLYAADGRSQFSLDSSAHDRQTIDGLASLFDAVVEIDGEATVRSRHILLEDRE